MVGLRLSGYMVAGLGPVFNDHNMAFLNRRRRETLLDHAAEKLTSLRANIFERSYCFMKVVILDGCGSGFTVAGRGIVDVDGNTALSDRPLRETLLEYEAEKSTNPHSHLCDDGARG